MNDWSVGQGHKRIDIAWDVAPVSDARAVRHFALCIQEYRGPLLSKINSFFFLFPSTNREVLAMSVTNPLDAAKIAFIESAISNNVLLFGTFTLKSGRSVPLHP